MRRHAAMQQINCCYANKRVAAGIWYTYIAPEVTNRWTELD
jgi:hypothetical protein